MTESLNLTDFAPNVGQKIEATTEAGMVELELIQAKALTAHRGAPRQDPFSLEFRAPKDCGLGQGTVKLQNQRLGPVDIFIVPVGQDEESLYFEATFN